jgi:cell division protein FtsL
MLRVINFLLLLVGLVSAFYLINQRYAARLLNMQLAHWQSANDELNKEYTRLQLEEGTYSSDLAIQDYAERQLGLIQADKQHIVELK